MNVSRGAREVGGGVEVGECGAVMSAQQRRRPGDSVAEAGASGGNVCEIKEKKGENWQP